MASVQDAFNEAGALRSAGFSLADIAHITGLSKSRLQRHFAKIGDKKPKPKTAKCQISSLDDSIDIAALIRRLPEPDMAAIFDGLSIDDGGGGDDGGAFKNLAAIDDELTLADIEVIDLVSDIN